MHIYSARSGLKSKNHLDQEWKIGFFPRGLYNWFVGDLFTTLYFLFTLYSVPLEIHQSHCLKNQLFQWSFPFCLFFDILKLMFKVVYWSLSPLPITYLHIHSLMFFISGNTITVHLVAEGRNLGVTLNAFLSPTPSYPSYQKVLCLFLWKTVF